MTFRLTIDLPQSVADRLADVLSDERSPAASVGAFDRGDGRWTVEAIFVAAPEALLLDRCFALAEASAHRSRAALVRLGQAELAAAIGAEVSPLRAGPFRILGPQHARRSATAWDVTVDAGGAFGDGWHPSTRLALLALSQALRDRRPRRVLDLGTGSGILAAAALRRLAHASAVASDRDPRAVGVAAATFATNGVARRVRLVRAAGLQDRRILARAPFDLVLANILPGPLIDLAGAIRACLAPRGRLVLSGIRLGEANRVLAAYRGRGLRLLGRVVEREWTALALERPGLGRCR